MIVCHCTGTSDHQIKRALQSGATSCRDVETRCGAGGVCGGCTPTIACLLRGKSALDAEVTAHAQARVALPA